MSTPFAAGYPTNFSYYAIPAMWTISIGAHWVAAGISYTSKDVPPFDNNNPRVHLDRIKKLEKQSPAVKRYVKAEAAQANGFENLGFFAAAITAGNVAGVPASVMNTLSASYLISRIIYNYLYIYGTTQAVGGLRSCTYVAGVGLCFTMFLKAGSILNGKLI